VPERQRKRLLERRFVTARTMGSMAQGKALQTESERSSSAERIFSSPSLP
jgi:hypothetical protein